MKSQIYKRLALVAMLISLVFVVTNVTAKKPVKPPKDPGQTTAECIVFTGDLETVPGSEVVEDCCPNAGPFPAYKMTLNLLDEDGITYQGQYDGQLFTKFSSNGPHKESKVQFWSWDSDIDTPGVGDIFFEIDGGDVVFDRKDDFLTVTFTEEQPTLWLYDHWEADGRCCAIEAPVLPVTFVLVRTSDLSYCGE